MLVRKTGRRFIVCESIMQLEKIGLKEILQPHQSGFFGMPGREYPINSPSND